MFWESRVSIVVCPKKGSGGWVKVNGVVGEGVGEEREGI